MKVLLDSSILCADYRLVSGTSQILLEGLARIGASCFVPELVLDEVAAAHRRQLEEIGGKFERLQKQWTQFTGRQLPPLLCKEVIASTTSEYADQRRARLNAAGIKILPYPDVSHRAIVERALKRHKPFNDGGAGYRDALIWHSTLALLEDRPAHVCLVTANAKDFGVAPTLHPDLQSDVKDGASVELFNTLEQFNAAKIVPVLERLENLIRSVGDGTFPSFSIRRWIDEHIVDAINEDEDSSLFVGLDPGHFSVHGSLLKKCQKVIVDDVRLLPSGDVLVMANADVFLKISVSADSEDCDRYRDVRDFFGGNCSGSPTAYIDEEGNIAFTLTLKKDTFEVQGCDIDAIETACCSVQINPHERRGA